LAAGFVTIAEYSINAGIIAIACFSISGALVVSIAGVVNLADRISSGHTHEGTDTVIVIGTV